MEQMPGKKFSSPEEEIAFLRAQIAERERELLDRSKEVDDADSETFARQELGAYAERAPHIMLHKDHQLSEHELAASTELVKTATDKATEILSLAREKGIRNALSVLEKVGDANTTDEVHRALVEQIRSGVRFADLKEGVPPWRVLHMTLFSIALPEHKEESAVVELQTLMNAMEQFYAGMQTVGFGKKPEHYTLEIAVAEGTEQIVFYVAVPNESVNLFEKQVLSLFPHAVIMLEAHDYNIFHEGSVSMTSVAKLKKHPVYPLRMHDTFDTDPLNVLLNAFSKIERDGGGAAVQLVIEAGGPKFHDTYEGIIRRVRDGQRPDVAIRKSTIGGGLFEAAKDIVVSSTKRKDDEPEKLPEVDQEAIELFGQKIDRPIVPTNIRIAVSAGDETRAVQIIGEIESSFNQFESTKGNDLMFVRQRGSAHTRTLRAFSFREFNKSTALPLSFAELATLLHFPSEGVESATQFKQSRAKTAPAPLDLPQHGTLLGVNSHRNIETKVYVTPEDRLRHFYIIGQTGTGKTVLMKNMIIQDIESGAGVCMIDPHGTDIADVLGAVPEERRDDIIYFDPSRMDMVMGLNMLEYDPEHPEQKTFVVNELFSIFQKLYGANPEALGPMFEQYFRNATQLVMEDPESSSTLLDISRVMVDPAYRRLKLGKARNPVVVQFWRDIATKAGGEAALENIVPYITSKFDVFNANDFMRPIVGQQHSSFNFREIMDGKKILLVNLAKGKLGEINSNLIGMIIVGKLLMAALSRVDDPTMSFPPFYLHIDEFQNVTTDSISSILSEARKYKLGLTIAHQFIAQLDEHIRDAVFGNVGSLAAFRVGPDDAPTLATQFEPVFDATDLMNIENRNAYVRILASGTPTRPFNIHTMAPKETDHSRVAALIEHSYDRYAEPRRKVEMDIATRYR